MVVRSTTLSKRENEIDVSRMSSVLGGSRMRSVLGGSVLGGDDLDGGADELQMTTMMATLSISPLFQSVKCGLKVKQLMQ